MSEISTKLNVEQQLLVTAAVDEILETTSVHQQALVRMLAVASEHNLNAANLLEDLSNEMHAATARDIPQVVGKLRSGVPAESALAQVPGVVPESVVMAMSAAQSQGLQKHLNQELLNAPTIRRSESDHAQDVSVAGKLTGLFWRYVITFGVLTFMMLFVIPQFKYLFDELGIDLPWAMQLLIEVANLVTYYWFVFAIVIFAVGLYLFNLKRHWIVSFVNRWIPASWQQPMLGKSSRKIRALAWVVQAGDGLTEAAIRFVSSNGIGVRASKRVAAAGKIETGGGVMETLTSERVVSEQASTVVAKASSGESAGWILRSMSRAGELKSRYRGLTWVRWCIWLGDFLLVFIGGWLAISIFQSSVDIIGGLVQ